MMRKHFGWTKSILGMVNAKHDVKLTQPFITRILLRQKSGNIS